MERLLGFSSFALAGTIPPTMQNSLTLLDRAARTLAQCVSVDVAKSIRDKAQALEIYARQQRQSVKMARECAIIRLRAERRIGQLLGGTVRAGNPQLSPGVTIGLGKLGITRNQSSKWQLTATLPDDDFENYLGGRGELTTNAIVKLAKAKRKPTMGARSGGNILTGDISRLFEYLENRSVDLILTDPPYERIDLYSQLGELAAQKLKPGCLCLAYCGHTFLPGVLTAMSAHLIYHWVFCIRFAGPHHPIHSKRIQNTWQPVVAFSKGKSNAPWIVDHLESGGREKDSHNHQKTWIDAKYLIEKLTDPGALIVDPFCGSGSILKAAAQVGREYLGCEIDSKMARVARGRVAA
jgi:16S rRNA G966 N2-methylase RsmD